MKRAIVLSCIVLAALSFPLYGQQKKVNVLFIGNSLTYQNDLPELVKKIAGCDGVQLQYKMIALPDYALEDHWNDGNAIRDIESGNYNFIVVQQGPSSQAEGYGLLKEYGLKFAQLSKKHHARLVFYMVWPSKVRVNDFPGVYKSYKSVAQQAQSIFSPAGQAWVTLWKTNPSFSLYSSDNFHPNDKGSLLAAMVIYGSISGRSNLNFIELDKLTHISLSKEDLKLLARAAEQTLAVER